MTVTTLRRGRLCRLIVLGVLSYGIVAGGEVSAEVLCGDTLGPGGKIALDADITTCTGAGLPALIIEGPVTVDMNGFQVKCTVLEPADGVSLIGSGVTLENGSVRGCNTYGIKLGDGGNHTISSVAVKATSGDGVVVESTENLLSSVTATNNNAGFLLDGNDTRVKGCVATNSTGAGFLVQSNSNRLSDNVATNNTNAGFQIDGDDNRLKRNVATTSGNEGIVVAGNNNRIKSNTTARNTQGGLSVSGNGNRFERNTATHNAGTGFEVTAGTDNRCKSSVATSNGGSGFKISGDETLLAENRAINNSGSGFLANAGTDNTIKRGLALESGGNDVRDVAACGGTSWSRNVFRTSNDVCIE